MNEYLKEVLRECPMIQTSDRIEKQKGTSIEYCGENGIT